MPLSSEPVEIVEVAPRDGFQSVREPIGTDHKIDMIDALVDAGCQRIEAGSFVNPKAVPQMADMADVSAGIRRKPDVRYMVLVPNRRGIELAFENSFREFGYVFSVSESHNQNNVRRSVNESLDDLDGFVSLLDSLSPAWRLRVNLATSFDCPFEGQQSPSRVLDLLSAVQRVVPNAEIALCDTTGRANPRQVSDLFERALSSSSSPETTWAYHGHDTFGLGVANALAAYDSGVRVFDSAAAGLGGCPFAPGATGNTATEDLVFAFEECGIKTGIDLGRLLEVADTVAAIPGACVASHLRYVPRQRALSGSR
jgi:hydroxymethylglutaryl-CoA lyase